MNIADAFQRHWRPLVLLFWLGTGLYLIWNGWGVAGGYGIQGFGLGDTDDNLRIMQVRGWLLYDQAWYDLRQYRLNPPDGLNVHWSRLVDLPIAGLWSFFGLFMDSPAAERWAVAIAPLIPLLVTMGALALTARRLLSNYAHWLPLALILIGGSALSMYAPLRIDHHGWQLAMLAVAVCGLADSRPVRGGITLGIASGLSLVIGLEMMLYLALAGTAVGLFWVADRAEAKRLATYGISFTGSTVLGFLIFASNDNWVPMCDALSPVWLSVVLAAGAIALALAWINPSSLGLRLGAAVVGGTVLAACYVAFWPDCLGRLERVPEELDRFWLSNVREAMPIWRHGMGTTVTVATLPAIGLIGYVVMLWRTRRDEQFRHWAAIGYLAALAMALLLWQTRAAAAAQLLAIPGVAALTWVAIIWFQSQRSALVRISALGGAVLVLGGSILSEQLGWWSDDGPPSDYHQKINNANWRCPQPWALHPVNQQPRGRVLTFVDMGPRLVTMTHHDAIAGPYHRNVDAILDVMRAFRGDAATAKEIIDRRAIDYVLLCLNMSESTIYRADTPEGFYVQLADGRAPDWLEPVRLPDDSPFRMWRVKAVARQVDSPAGPATATTQE